MNEHSREQLFEQLRALRRRLRFLFLAHGVGALLLGASALTLHAYGVDRLFHLPASLRLGVLAVSCALLAVLFYRKVYFPLRRKIEEKDLALAVERRFPELRDRVVSAIEISARDSRSPELSEELYRSACEGLSHLPAKEIFNSTPPGRLLGLGAVGMLICAGVFFADREAAGIWLRRFLGENVPWPQQTFLDVQIAESAGSVRVERKGSSLRVEIARGNDLPVRVTANGTVPDSVTLHLPGGKTRSMLRTGEREFTHLFPAVREPMRFWVTGGDDQDEEPSVEVYPDQAPELAKIAVQLTFPEYSGLASVTREGGGIEALIGTRAEILIEPSRSVARGAIRLQQSGESIALTPMSEGPDGKLHAFLEIKNSDRYTVELYNDREIKSPDSGSYPIVAIPDRKPEIRMISPSRGDLDATPRARVPLRADLRDDFGVKSALLLVKTGKDGEVREIPLLAEANAVEGAKNDARWQESIEWPLEITELRVGDRPPMEGESLLIRLRVTDNRLPQPNLSESGEIRVVLVSDEEIERRIQDNLGRVKEAVQTAEGLQRERLDRVQDLLAVLEAEGKLAESEASGLRNVSVGQSRVVSSTRAIATQLSDTFELALFNRFHRDANAWIQIYEEGQRSARRKADAPHRDESTADALARENREGILALRAAVREGKLAPAEPLGKLSEMAEISSTLAEEASKKALSALEAAGLNKDPEAQKKLLAQANETQKQCLASMERLLSMLAEWDNYQTVINLAKELLDRQRSIQTRTKEWVRQNK